MLTGEGLMVGTYAAKKLLFPTAGFLASCPPGVAVVPWVAAIIKLNPTTLPGSQRRLIEGSVKKCKKSVTAQIALLHTHGRPE